MALKIAVLASGSGRTLQNFIDRSLAGTLAVEILCVGVSKASCFALERAKKVDIPTFVEVKKRSQSVSEFSTRVFSQIRPFKPDLVCLAGYVHLLEIPEDFKLRVLNIHPSLIPAFAGKGYYGSKVHEAAWNRGVTVSGCTVHYCDNIYDHGPILLQKAVSVLGANGPEEIGKLVFEAELEAYPEALGLIADGKVEISSGRCHVKIH